MKDAIDQLIAAFDPHACQAVSRQADQSLVFTVNDKAHGASVTKVIPLRALDCQTTLSTVIKDIQRDLDHSTGHLSRGCAQDLQTRGPRIRRYHD